MEDFSFFLKFSLAIRFWTHLSQSDLRNHLVSMKKTNLTTALVLNEREDSLHCRQPRAKAVSSHLGALMMLV